MTITDQMHRTIEIPDRPQRIISIVPSQTELLHDLALGDRVVGITKFCVHPEEWFRSKTRVGGTKKLDLEKIRSLRPDLIIGNKEENDRDQIRTLEKEFPVWMSDVRDLPAALEMIEQIGRITGTAAAAATIYNGIETAFRSLVPNTHRVSVAYLIWRDPYMVAGGDTFIDDMLCRCGFVNSFRSSTERYPVVSPEALVAAAPRLILLASEPYPFGPRHRQEIQRLLPDAVILLADGELFSWYGGRLRLAPAYFNNIIQQVEG